MNVCRQMAERYAIGGELVRCSLTYNSIILKVLKTREVGGWQGYKVIAIAVDINHYQGYGFFSLSRLLGR